jgi:hypothetical protein
MRITFLSAIAIGTSMLFGCGSGSPSARTTSEVIEYDVYPADVLVLEPGQAKDVKVSRKGDAGKESELSITSSDPKVKVEGGKFAGGSKDATVTVRADADAPAKEHTLTIKVGGVTKTVHVRVGTAKPVSNPTVEKATPKSTSR